jgi:hypothetical protein
VGISQRAGEGLPVLLIAAKDDLGTSLVRLVIISCGGAQCPLFLAALGLFCATNPSA